MHEYLLLIPSGYPREQDLYDWLLSNNNWRMYLASRYPITIPKPRGKRITIKDDREMLGYMFIGERTHDIQMPLAIFDDNLAMKFKLTFWDIIVN